jgi:hypothetical protein
MPLYGEAATRLIEPLRGEGRNGAEYFRIEFPQ